VTREGGWIVRTALRRGRRLGAFLLLALSAWYLVLRRRSSAVRWVEPPPVPVPAEPGPAGELPADVLATDAGLTALPDPDVDAAEPPAGTVTVDEARVAELLAGSSDADLVVVEEADYEDALAAAAPEPTAPPETPAEAAASAEPDASAEPERAPEAALEAIPGADGVDEVTETQLVAPTGVDGETATIAFGAPAYDDEETSTQIPMPTFSEMPTMEIPAVTDDLRAVRGIGPSMERMLHGLGIVSFRQLALLDGAELERVRAELSDFRSRIEREDWVGQARDLHKEKYGRDPG
jgi:predicted flap endonuclease-1-like 5' DNA nuclease